MTQKVLDKLPEKVLSTIQMWKERYNNKRLDKEITRAELRGYVRGLVDADILTEQEFRVVFAYVTL